MSDLDILAELVARHYGATEVRLHPVHQFEVAGRGIYRVEHGAGRPWLLRAYQGETEIERWLAGRAAVLLFLEQANFPAPRVTHTLDGRLMGRQDEWTALLLTYIDGEMVGNSLEDFHAIGASLGRLHGLSPTPGAPLSPQVPPCRWQPASRIASWLEQLVAIATQTPPELQGLHDFAVATLQRVLAWPPLPMTILHTDCWANNAIRTAEGQMVLVDWDGAGWGPAILDLGYLLVACHAFLPEWPQIAPSEERIAAVMAGYQQRRAITAVECELLYDGLCFAEAFRAAQWLPEALPGDWRKHRGLLRFQARYPVTAEIARLALRCVAPARRLSLQQ